MGDKTKIQWADATWSPVTGCTPVSDGCDHCYARRQALRLQAMGQPNYKDGFSVRCHEHMLGVPEKWRRPRRIFVCSMADLFHKDVPYVFLARVVEVMRRSPQHLFLVLTKRARRMAEFIKTYGNDFPKNCWVGVTIENQASAWRAYDLETIQNVSRKFISFEPLLGPVEFHDHTGAQLYIVGGESGPGARPLPLDTVKTLRDTAQRLGISFFFKQWGSFNFQKGDFRRDLHGIGPGGLPLLDGVEWGQFPEWREDQC